MVHNLSSMTLSQEERQLLGKGLSFAPTPKIPVKKAYTQVLDCFDSFAKSVRQKYVDTLRYFSKAMSVPQEEPTTTSKIYRPMKFVPKSKHNTLEQQFSGVSSVEHYIELTKNNLNNLLPVITLQFTSNISKEDEVAIKKFKQMRDRVTIKPADKNLGIVLMDTDDYLAQCTSHLADITTYRLAEHYPRETIRRHLMNTVTSFKPQLSGYNKRLYEFLLSEPDHSRIPQFYGIPKIHKKFSDLPPVRPIVSQCNSPLTRTAKFVDHSLQPLAQSYW